MNTTTLEQPAAVRAAEGGLPARRAVVRWGWRLFRREWRQQLLVLTLIIVAVAAAILGAAIGTNTPPAANAGFGTANHLVTLPGSDPHLAGDIAAIKQSFGVVDVIDSQRIATGVVGGAELRAQDPRGPYAAAMLALVSGRYPGGAGDVAMTTPLASTFDLHIGDAWHEAGNAYRVVGLVENPQNLVDNFALVAPGQLASPDQVTVLFDATPESVAAFTFLEGATPVTPQTSSGISPAIIVLVLDIFGLIFVGLVAVAGFTVLAQRRLRALGMLSSLGATDRNVRLVMIANGAAVGVAGAVIGAVTGLATWIAYAPHLQTSSHHRVVWTNLPWWLIATAMALAVVAAILAARRPARAVTDISVVSALSGRPPSPRGMHRSALPGAGVLIIGLVLMASSGGWGASGGKDMLFVAVGIVAVVGGLLLLVPLCVSVLAVIARHAPIAARIALRDLARYRARSGPALAATGLAVFIAVLISLIATGRYADAFDYFGPNLPSNQVILYAPGYDAGGGGGPGPGDGADLAQQSSGQLQARADAIAASLGSHDVLALESTDVTFTHLTSQGPKGVHGNVYVGVHGNIYVATSALLAHYGIKPSVIDPATLLITSRPGLEGTRGSYLARFSSVKSPEHLGCPPGSCVTDPKIQTIGNLPKDASDPNLLVTGHAVTQLGLNVTRAAWLIQTPRPLTSVQINTARRMAASAGMTIETKSDAPSLAQLRNYATAAGILLALGVLAMTVGLIRSETAGDVRTLTATGASSRARRTLTGATAGAIGLLGALLGTALAYLATVAFFHSQLSERMSHAPALDLLLILIGLPVVAAAGGWVFGGREPVAIARSAIE